MVVAGGEPSILVCRPQGRGGGHGPVSDVTAGLSPRGLICIFPAGRAVTEPAGTPMSSRPRDQAFYCQLLMALLSHIFNVEIKYL